jgi:hypothetical protein
MSGRRTKMNIREELIDKLAPTDDRLEYDEHDEAKIVETANRYTQTTVLLLEAIGKYVETMRLPIDENSADLMKEARYDVVYSWAVAQAAVSKIAWMMRIDGDEAYGRIMDGAMSEEHPDLHDL